MRQQVLDPFHEHPVDSLQRRQVARNARSKFFIVWACFYWIASSLIIILVPIAMVMGRVFTIVNRSNYIEVANLFLQIDFYLQGHCLTLVDHTVQCKRVPFYEAFYRLPYWGNMKEKMTLTDLAGLLQSVSVQNPVV